MKKKLPRICGGFLNVTQKCNLNCKYCFVVQQPLEMTYTTAKDAVDFYAKNALAEAVDPQITFFGGEPMLRWKDIVKPIIEYVRSTYGEFKLNITTNGTLLNEGKLQFLKQNDVGILLSIDGDQKTQDKVRPYHSGKGSFKDIDVDLYLKYYPNGTFRATIDPDAVENVYENYLWAEEKGYTNAAMIINSFGEWTEDKTLTLKEEVQKITDRIINKKSKGENYLKFNEIESMESNSILLNNIDSSYFRDAGQELPACGRCGLGASIFGSIGSSGDIYSCQEMTENKEFDKFKIGNIYSGVDDAKRLEIANSFNTRDVRSAEEGKCKECILNQVCNGGCTINNYFKSGYLTQMPKIMCEMYPFYLEKYREIYGGK